MEVKKNPKADVGRNSSLYFAVGLNVMLVLTYLGLEHKTYETATTNMDILLLSEQIEEDIPITTIDLPPPPPPKVVVTEAITIVEDVDEIEETVIESTEITQDDAIEERVVSVDDLNVEEAEEEIEIPFSIIESVPVFPGCKGNNEELKACFQRKMNEHLQKHFQYPEAAAELGIKGRVHVLFLIDKTGQVSRIKSRGPDRLLEEEAERIISKLPKMEPGKQRNKPVGVPYSLPINFQLQGN